MLKRNSNFTLIELIVVIVVLGILAAIVIPNISSFAKQAREAQYTADLRNIQTGFDMESATSADLVSSLVLENTEAKFDVTHEFKENDATKELELTAFAEAKKFTLVDVGAMIPSEMRKLPKYVAVPEVTVAEGTGVKSADAEDAFAKIVADPKRITVVVGVELDAKGKSTAVLSYIGNEVSGADTVKTVIR